MITSVKLSHAGLSGSASLEGVREYTKTFTVITDTPSDGVMTVGNAAGLPQKGDSYSHAGETDSGALCWNVDPQQDGANHLVWRVTCRFSSDMKGGAGGTLGDPDYDVDNPLQAPPVVTWGSWEETEVVTHDIHDVAILNTADQPPVPPLTRQRKRRAVTIERNEAAYPTALDQDYNNAINSDVFYGWPIWTARVDDITAHSQFAQNMQFWVVRYVIHFKEETWLARMANVGMRHIDDANAATPKLVIAEDDGVATTYPVQLDQNGERMTRANIPVWQAFPPTSTPGWEGLFWNWEINKPKPFSALNL